jgi:16S rRNA G966 N2-methylase RsmD
LNAHELIQLLSSPEVLDYVENHAYDDPKTIVLRQGQVHGVSGNYIAQQIEGRRKTKTKLPTWHQTRGVVYPASVNLEQSSSELTASFKASILKAHTINANVLVDLTGGFGVDSYAFSQVFRRVIHVEPDETLSAIARHNHNALRRTNIEHVAKSAEEYLSSSTSITDAFYIDPSRRNELRQKVFMLKDTVPDVTALLPQLLGNAELVLIKTSPLLDLLQMQRQLTHLQSLYVIAVNNECKELLAVCRRGFRGEPSIHAINLTQVEESFTFTFSEEQHTVSVFSAPKKFLYEPNAAILKAGAFKSVGEKFHLSKLHVNTHFYTAESCIMDFPGRIFEVHATIKSDPKEVSKFFSQGKANVITRNYPLTPDELKRKLKLGDGGEGFVIGTTSLTQKVLFAASRVK